MAKPKQIDFDYTAASARLDEIVAGLQSRDVSVDEALLLHKEGMELVQAIELYLKEAEYSIKKLNILT